MDKSRPSPETFLAEARQAESRQNRGRLKIFLGAAPGVGKTYSMLQSARGKKAEEVDVLVGLAETHGRVETEALLQGLDILPRKSVEHRGIKLQEFDLDGALSRKPGLILVDELAHSNAPGCRHAKRWQDVVELLDRGFDVYTTLNVQHLESLKDVVAQVTGVRVHESVPDSVLERAEVELVDLPPEELLERLQEGKVYFHETAARAADNFFKISNLTALRELALRVTAEGVGAQVESQRRRQAPQTIWPISERLLVCVGPGPNSARLIRAAKRMAAGLRAEWIAVFIENQRQSLSDRARAGAVENLRLAERLGAETLTLSARDVVEGTLDLARQRNVTKIIVGKTERPRWLDLLSGSIVDELIRKSGEIDVYVIRGEAGAASPSAGAFSPKPVSWSEYGLALAAVAACTGLCFAIFPFVQLINLVMAYLLVTLLVAARGHRGPAVLASVLGILCFDFYFVPPRFSFNVADTQYGITFLAMLAAAVIISHLTVRIRTQAELAGLGEMRTAAMHALSRRLASTRGIENIFAVSLRHIAEVFDSELISLMPDQDGRLTERASSGQKRDLDEKERSVAQWVFDLGQSAGLGTQTLPVVDALYIPLIGAEGPVGVLRVQPNARERLLIPDQMLLLESFAHQLALALEVDRLQDNAKQSQLNAEKERLRSSLLSSVSHDLRTPLAAIIGSASSLLQGGSSVQGKDRELLENIQEEGERLSRLVHNLIETTRLTSGTVQLRKEPYPIEELVGSSLDRLEKLLAGRKVAADIPEDLPLVPLDSVLLEQVFINLLENAARHTPAGIAVDIAARTEQGAMLVEVSDRGPGLAADELERIFEKFYHAKSSSAGAGLGLAICRAIIDAHGGRIWAENRPGGGAVFRFTLPLPAGSAGGTHAHG
ncbi:MAG: sensor histidine kinase KdpD [Elusimicrobiota bacterium]|jgi:two-component system sensor histidine kinase KdpD